jgi:hypothetical protein
VGWCESADGLMCLCGMRNGSSLVKWVGDDESGWWEEVAGGNPRRLCLSTYKDVRPGFQCGRP